MGKSTLVRTFAQDRGLNLLEVNLERHRHLEPVFESFDVSRILLELESAARGSAMKPGTLIFLDEIQATPSALAALRYFYEDRPELPLMAAGSLLEGVLKDHAFAMPVGRIEYLHLGPMTFEEFLAPLEPHLLSSIQNWEFGAPFSETLHRQLLHRQQEFLFVGGMPEAVDAFASGEGVETVRDIQRSIVDTYRDDFAKYGKGAVALARLGRVFDYLPSAVGTKVKYSNISREDRARELKSAIELLALARVIWPVHHGSASGLPLQAEIDPDRYKCLFLDVGLTALMTGLSWSALGQWNDRQLMNEGRLAEQFIGQHLLFRHRGDQAPALSYWLREGKSTNAEVDYVIESNQRVVPVEVKSGTSGKLRSLHAFFGREVKGPSPKLALRFDLNAPSLQDHRHRLTNGRSTEVQYRLLSLPLYLVQQAARLLEAAGHLPGDGSNR